MKSFLIIGMGSFGHHLCRKLCEQKCEIMIVDERADALEDMLPYVTSAKIGDCTNIDVLQSFGIHHFDACFVCVGSKFQDSLEITSLLKEIGAKKVFSKAEEDLQAKFLLVDIQRLNSDGTFADGGSLRWRPDQGPSPDWPTVSPRHGSSANALYFGGNVSIHPTGNAMPYHVDPFRTDSDNGIHWKN